MGDLFRFLMLRPADVVLPSNIKVLTGSFVKKGVTFEGARKEARNYVDNGSLLVSTEGLKFASAALAVVSGVGPASVPAKDVSAIVKKVLGQTAADVVALPQFTSEEQLLADSLVAMWLLSDSSGGDAPALARLALGYDAIHLTGTGRDPIALRVLSIDDLGRGSSKPAQPPRPEPEKPATPSKGDTAVHTAIRNLDEAIATLKTLPASGFRGSETAADTQRALVERIDTRLAALEKTPADAVKQQGAASPQPVVTRPWVLSAAAICCLPRAVQETISEAGLDVHTQALPVILNALYAKKIDQMTTLEKLNIPQNSIITQVGGTFIQTTRGEQ